MHSFRRAAVRMLAQQPSRTVSSFRPAASRLTVCQTATPSLCRSFQSARIWRAEETEKKEMAAEETTTEETEPTIKEKAQELVSSAAETVQSAVGSTTAALSSRSPRQATNPDDFPPRTPDSRVLYVSNAPWEATEDEVKAEFGRIGTVTNVRMVQGPDGRAKGFGWVGFAEEADAQTALEQLNNADFLGRRIFVSAHRPKERQPRERFERSDRPSRPARNFQDNPPCDTLFIGNMSFQMSDRDLNDVFRDIQKVVDVRVAIDRATGQPRGFAHAEFVNVEAAEKAKQYLEKKVIFGRQLRVSFSAPSQGRGQRGGRRDDQRDE